MNWFAPIFIMIYNNKKYEYIKNNISNSNKLHKIFNSNHTQESRN